MAYCQDPHRKKGLTIFMERSFTEVIKCSRERCCDHIYIPFLVVGHGHDSRLGIMKKKSELWRMAMILPPE